MGMSMDLAGLVALCVAVVTIALQIIKPLIEMVPALGPSKPAHDPVLRLMNLVLQAALLVAVRLTLAQFAGLTWLDILALTFGQTMVAHSTYTLVRGQSGTPTVAPALGAGPMMPPAGPVA